MDSSTIIVALISALAGAFLQPVVVGWINRRKSNAESRNIEKEYWQEITKDLRTENKFQAIRIENLEQRQARLENAFNYLTEEVKGEYPNAVKIAREIANIPNNYLIPDLNVERRKANEDFEGENKRKTKK